MNDVKKKNSNQGGIGKYRSMSPGHFRTAQSGETEKERITCSLRTKASEYKKEIMVAQPT